MLYRASSHPGEHPTPVSAAPAFESKHECRLISSRVAYHGSAQTVSNAIFPWQRWSSPLTLLQLRLLLRPEASVSKQQFQHLRL